MAALQSICIDGFCSEVDLSNYYNKSEVNQLINAIETGGFEVVQTLPATGEDKIIYLVPNQGSTPNIYDEYIYVNNNWEKIGTTEMDLSNYYNKTETDALLDDKQDVLTAGANIQIANDTISATDTTYDPATTTTAGLMSAADKTKLDGLQNYTAGQNITITNGEISATDTTYDNATQSAAGLMSAADKTKLDGIEAGAEANQDAYGNVKVGTVTIAATAEQDTIEFVAGTGVTLTPDATNKTVTVAVNLTKAQLLSILGAQEVTISKTDASGTVSGYFLGSVTQTPAS